MILVYIHTYKVTGVKDPDGPLGLTPKLIWPYCNFVSYE
jgi:hypothetical protein